MIKPLTSLRFFFALMVFLSHIGFLYGIDKQSQVDLDFFAKEFIAFKEGYLGVSFFFILSGFILTYNYSEKFKNKAITYKDYMRARFFRIVPLHWLTLLISIVLSILIFIVIMKNDSSYPPTPLGSTRRDESLPEFSF